MLRITIPALEYWDESKNEFVTLEKDVTLQLEHSLVSLSRWESKWKKPFMTSDAKTIEETKDYIRCMTISQNIDPKVYDFLTNSNIQAVKDYIDDPMTATTFVKNPSDRPSREVVTSELIYYWMIALNVPMECQKWHLNRLLTLIKVCNIKNTPPKKMGKADLAKRNSALNAARRKKHHTRG